MHRVLRVLSLLCCTLGEAARPRGVRPAELATMYNPGQAFKCFDGSNTVAFAMVNDDYCDCEDGSDEPGTSACSSARFYCENAGHKAALLLSSRVGDGICDCCDGSDEWSSGVSCGNTCDELGRSAREAEEARVRVIQEGLNKRQGMVNQAKVMLEEKRVQLQEKEMQKTELEAAKVEKERLKEEAEAPEKEALDYYRQIEEEETRRQEEEKKAAEDAAAAETFAELDGDGDGVVTVAELQARPGLDTNKDGEVTEEEAKFFLGDKDSFDLDSFKDGAYALIKPYLDLEKVTAEPEDPVAIEDEGMVPPAEEYHPPDHPMMKDTKEAAYDPEKPDYPMNTPPPPTDIDGVGDGDYDEHEEDEDEDYDISDHEEEDDHKAEEEQEAAKPESKYDERTQALIAAAEAARAEYNSADRQLRDLEREITRLSEGLGKEYGPDSVFAVLQGTCFEYTDNEYTYKMCPFDMCSQRGKSGGAETRLGGWGEWTGPDHDRHASMKFTGGQTCWNGPARSTLVHLHCGGDNQLTAVSEPNRCEYEMHFTTPAVCSAAPPSGHDEL